MLWVRRLWVTLQGELRRAEGPIHLLEVAKPCPRLGLLRGELHEDAGRFVVAEVLLSGLGGGDGVVPFLTGERVRGPR